MIAPDDPKTNHLLAALPAEEWARWLQQDAARLMIERKIHHVVCERWSGSALM